MTGLPFRILVIDDKPQIRKFMEISLRAQGYVVEQAANGEAGLAALDAGANDYVTKPFSMQELMTRTRAGGAQQAVPQLEIDGLHIDLARREALVDGQPVALMSDDAASPRWIVTEPGVGLKLRDGPHP